MSKAQPPSSGNGSFAQDAKAVGARLEELGEEVDSLADTLGDTARDMSGLVRRQLENHPYRTLGVAAGVGFVFGGGMSVRMTSALLGLGGRLLANRVLQEVLKESQV